MIRRAHSGFFPGRRDTLSQARQLDGILPSPEALAGRQRRIGPAFLVRSRHAAILVLERARVRSALAHLGAVQGDEIKDPLAPALTRSDDERTPEQQTYLAILRKAWPEAWELERLAREFIRSFHDQDASTIGTWIQEAEMTSLRRCARGLFSDMRGNPGGHRTSLAQRPDRGTHQPSEDHQATDVRPSGL